MVRVYQAYGGLVFCEDFTSLMLTAWQTQNGWAVVASHSVATSDITYAATVVALGGEDSAQYDI